MLYATFLFTTRSSAAIFAEKISAGVLNALNKRRIDSPPRPSTNPRASQDSISCMGFISSFGT
jgi:hypothetical protein